MSDTMAEQSLRCTCGTRRFPWHYEGCPLQTHEDRVAAATLPTRVPPYRGASSLNEWCLYEAARAVKNGWNKSGVKLTPEEFATKIALIHSEISEALEAYRTDAMDTHLPHRRGAEVELGDAVIRIFELCGTEGYDLGGAVVEKDAYNDHRPDHKPENRAKAHGKKF